MSITGFGEIAGLATAVIEKLWPNKSEQEKAELQAALVMVQGQLDVNKAEAAHPSVFVAGWRPFIGWVCGVACAWNWIGLPIAKVALALAGGPTLGLAPASLTEMLPVLMGMLGLGAYRTAEKFKGVARS
jgi:acyl-CoA reductase-like NAD-dependent aldehyde dehydrogenase